MDEKTESWAIPQHAQCDFLSSAFYYGQFDHQCYNSKQVYPESLPLHHSILYTHSTLVFYKSSKIWVPLYLLKTSFLHLPSFDCKKYVLSQPARPVLDSCNHTVLYALNLFRITIEKPFLFKMSSQAKIALHVSIGFKKKLYIDTIYNLNLLQQSQQTNS